MSIAMPVAHPIRVGLMMLAAGVLMSMMVVFARLSAETHAIIEITFFRNAVGAAVIAVMMLTMGEGKKLFRTSRPFDHFLRGLSGLVGLACNFWAATLLPLADASALFFSMPMIVTVLGIPLLREHVDWRRWVCVIAGFAGILIVAQPSGDVPSLGIMVALAGAFFSGLSVVMVRKLGSTESEQTTVFYFFTIGALISAAFLPWHWTMPSLESFMYLVCTALAGMSGQLLMTRAYAQAPVGYISSFNYLSILYGTFFGWLLWSEWPSAGVFVGAAIIISAGLSNIALEKTRTVKAESDVEATYG